MVLAKSPLCVLDCERQARTTVANEADHIVPLSLWLADPILAAAQLAKHLTLRGIAFQPDDLHPWSLLNGQGACKPCHSRKTATESSGWAR